MVFLGWVVWFSCFSVMWWLKCLVRCWLWLMKISVVLFCVYLCCSRLRKVCWWLLFRVEVGLLVMMIFGWLISECVVVMCCCWLMESWVMGCVYRVGVRFSVVSRDCVMFLRLVFCWLVCFL